MLKLLKMTASCIKMKITMFTDVELIAHFCAQDSVILTDLRGCQTLFGQLEDLLFDIIRCELQPLKVKVK